MAGAFPSFAPGDLMVSLRNLDTIAVLDRDTHLVKWRMTGPFLRQHDPDFLPNGHILVLDNRKGGRAREFGPSRVLEIDPARREVVWSYQGSERAPFYTDAQGKLQFLQNGYILVAETQAGRVFEVSRASGRVVWEWVNGIGDGLVGWVTQAERVAADRVGPLDGPCGGGWLRRACSREVRRAGAPEPSGKPPGRPRPSMICPRLAERWSC